MFGKNDRQREKALRECRWKIEHYQRQREAAWTRFLSDFPDARQYLDSIAHMERDTSLSFYDGLKAAYEKVRASNTAPESDKS